MNEASTRNSSNSAVRWLGGIALGAAAMYLADPERGKRRRALAKDKMQSLAARTGSAIDVASRDLGNRVQGLRAQANQLMARRHLSADDTDDVVVAARIRSRLGRAVTHPHAIKVMVQDGQATLNGPVLASEKEQLLKAVHSVRGVRAVEDHLQTHEHAANIAALQGNSRPRQLHFSFLHDNWPPGLRAVAAVGGSLLGYYGMTRRSPLNMLLGAFGIGVLARAATNLPLGLSAQTVRGNQAIHLNKTIHIEASPDTVFDFWSKVENFPYFMSHVKEVRDLGDGRSHWMVGGPAGLPVQWDAILTEAKRPQKLAWRTEEDAPVQHAGEVHFEPELTGTRVSVHMSYAPPAGVFGHAVASLFGANPKRDMDDDLMRMKAFIETGIPPHDAAQHLRPSDPYPGPDVSVH